MDEISEDTIFYKVNLPNYNKFRFVMFLSPINFKGEWSSVSEFLIIIIKYPCPFNLIYDTYFLIKF